MDSFKHPEESYSRRLDEKVFEEEMPYGYDSEPPAADTDDFDQHKLESSRHNITRRK